MKVSASAALVIVTMIGWASAAKAQVSGPTGIKANLPDCVTGFKAGSKDGKGGYDCISTALVCPADGHVLSVKPYSYQSGGPLVYRCAPPTQPPTGPGVLKGPPGPPPPEPNPNNDGACCTDVYLVNGSLNDHDYGAGCEYVPRNAYCTGDKKKMHCSLGRKPVIAVNGVATCINE